MKEYEISKFQLKGAQFLHLACQGGGLPPCPPSVTPLWTTLTLKRFTRNAKHGFNSWKCSKLTWNSSNGLYFSILPFCDLQLPFFAKSIHSLSDIGKEQNAFDNACLRKIWVSSSFFRELK